VILTALLVMKHYVRFIMLLKVVWFLPSMEDFGIPVLESMACGTPVVASNSSSLPEVAGWGCILVATTSVSRTYRAIDSLFWDYERAYIQRNSRPTVTQRRSAAPAAATFPFTGLS